ncbi:hypothetical protein P692DRAFT_20882652 [Suillus brevipes Sb2]|nr:hypothetical protein P692DRAFT_20882652 [Suillus brevipes Sb2]
MSTSCLPPFNSSAIRTGMSELSSILIGPQWLDFYIRLIPTETIRTELYLLYFLLKGRVYLGDIWQIVGERLLEAQREESLRSTKDSTVRGIIERAYMEEKRNRCQLEVSLCSQAIDCLQQRWIMPICGVATPIAHNLSPFSTPSRCHSGPDAPYSAAAVAYLAAVKKKCEGWLRRQRADLSPAQRRPPFNRRSHPNGSTSSAVHQFTITHHVERGTSVIVDSIDPSFCLSSTWVPPGVQDALIEARKAELSAQAGLMTTYLDIDGYNSHQRNANSELLYLRARMHRAKAEVEVYELAIENAPTSNFPDSATASSASSSSSHLDFSPLLPEDVCRYKDYINAESLDDNSTSEYL